MTEAVPYRDYFPYGVNVRVPLMQYAADVELGSTAAVYFGAPLALSTTYFANVVLSTTGVALALTVSAGTILNSGLVPGTSASKPTLWGRGLTFVGDGASTRTITCNGYDYLGQPMRWTGVLNGATPVPCPKAFMWITDVTFGAAADTVSVSIGYNNVFGLPYAANAMSTEMKNQAPAANAGTFVAALADATAATATNADTKGTYLPVTVIPDGTNVFEIRVITRRGNLHGNAQFTS